MRPMSLVLVLAASLPLLAPVSAFAGTKPPPDPEGVELDDPVEGDYFFIDKIATDRLKTVVSIDQKAGEICINSLLVQLDTTRTLNRRVEFFILARGDIGQQGPGRLQGEFVSPPIESLTLFIYDGPENTAGLLFETTLAPAPCEISGVKLNKIGTDFDEDPDELVGTFKAKLSCEFGEELIELIDPKTKGADELVDILRQAIRNRKTIRLKVPTGDFRVTHNGIRVDPDLDADALDFSLLTGCAPPPPPPPE
jgi:hypothetical protein